MNALTNLKCTLALSAGFCSSFANAQKQPHIILIMTDQQRGDAVGCMGNEFVITPHLDKLANEGTLFMNAYSSCPSSTPARAGLLTGMSPWHHGMLGYGRVAPKYECEMPQMLKDAGYYTFGIGKMHWYPQRVKHGFDGTLLDESGRRQDPHFTSDYRQWFQVQAPGKNPDATGIWWNDHGAGVYKLDEKLHPTYWTGEMACNLISHYDPESRPLFLKVSFARPHSPYDPPQRFLDMYDNVDVPDPAIGDWCGRYAKQLNPEEAASDAPYGNFGNEYVRNSKRHYYANITFIDEQIGRIVQALKDKGMYDNALIFFVSDHGDMMGDHYHWRKTYPYEGSVHVPCIAKWPASVGVVAEKIDNPVELRDVLPTFLDIAGATVPADMDGCPLLPLAKGTDTGWREYIDLEHATCYSRDNYWCALTDGKIKYVWRFYTGQEELFDLVADPQELHNAVNDKEYKERLEKLRARMIRHLGERGEEFVKDGRLVVRKKKMLYSPHYPKE